MRDRILQMSKQAVFAAGVIVAAVFLIGMDLIGMFLMPMVSLAGYGNSMIAEFGAGILAVVFLVLFGEIEILGRRGQGFVKGIYIGGFLTAYCFLEIAAQLYMQAMNQNLNVVSAPEIFYFIAAMFLIGWTEELVFRGVILNLFLERFSKTKTGILAAVVFSGILFGAVHLTNIFHGISVESAVVQAVTAAFLGIILGAVYVRSGNIWIVIVFHMMIDFGSLMGSGIFGAGTTTEQINQISVLNLAIIPILLVPCFVLLRSAKLEELEQKANHMIVFDTYKEAEQNGILSLVLGIFSVFTGFMGYGLGLAVVGIIGAYLSRKVKTEKNKIAWAGMVLSCIGAVVSVFGMIYLCMLYSNMEQWINF